MDGAAIGENLVAEFAAAAVALVVGWLILLRQSRALAGLLGANSRRRVVIVLPYLWVKKRGTLGTYRRNGYSGPAVTLEEYQGAVALSDALTGPFSRLFGRRLPLGGGPVVEAVTLSPSPDDVRGETFEALPGGLAGRSLVVLGGPAYNPVARLALDHPARQVAPELPEGGEWGVRVLYGPQRGQFFAGRDNDTKRELAVIEGVPVSGRNGAYVTVVAGAGDHATRMAIEFLLNNSRRIRRNCRGKPYALLLCIDGNNEPRCLLGLADGKGFVI